MQYFSRRFYFKFHNYYHFMTHSDHVGSLFMLMKEMGRITFVRMVWTFERSKDHKTRAQQFIPARGNSRWQNKLGSRFSYFRIWSYRLFISIPFTWNHFFQDLHFSHYFNSKLRVQVKTMWYRKSLDLTKTASWPGVSQVCFGNARMDEKNNAPLTHN